MMLLLQQMKHESESSRRLPFRFNQDIKYQVGPYKNFIHTDDSLIKQDIQVTSNEGDSFRANFTNVFEKYIRPPITTEWDMNLWRSNSFGKINLISLFGPQLDAEYLLNFILIMKIIWSGLCIGFTYISRSEESFLR